jgi:hypothetical protein
MSSTTTLYTDQMTGTWSSTTTFIAVDICTTSTVITVGRDGKFVLLCGVELGHLKRYYPACFVGTGSLCRGHPVLFKVKVKGTP